MLKTLLILAEEHTPSASANVLARLLRLAGFQVSITGRLWVSTEVENCWSKLKALLKSWGARTRHDLDAAIAECMQQITAHDALAWFRHCGYSG